MVRAHGAGPLKLVGERERSGVGVSLSASKSRREYFELFQDVRAVIEWNRWNGKLKRKRVDVLYRHLSQD
jgi:hypothetical protein